MKVISDRFDFPIHWDLLPIQDVGFTFVGDTGIPSEIFI